MVNSHLVAANYGCEKGARISLWGIERAGLQVADVDFIPLKQESYDMIVFKRDMELPVIRRLIENDPIARFYGRSKATEGL